MFGVFGSVGDFGLQQPAVSVAYLDANTTVSGACVTEKGREGGRERGGEWRERD